MNSKLIVNSGIKISKDHRITIPQLLIRNLEYGDYFKVNLSTENKVGHFYMRTSKKCPSRKYIQMRRKLPKETIQELKLKSGSIIQDVKLEKIEKRFMEIIDNNCLDILALNIKEGVIDTFTKGSTRWIIVWKSRKEGGIMNPVELKRFIPINRSLGEFFGLMQAESRKGGHKFEFTNISIELHQQFLNSAKEYFGIPPSAWKFGVIYNPKYSDEKVEYEKKKFGKVTGIIQDRGYVTKSNTVSTFAYQIYIDKKMLNHVMNYLLISLRNPSDKDKELLIWKEFYTGFIIKCMRGDGHITLNKQLNHIEIVLTEPDRIAQINIIEILNLFGIKASVNGIRIDISTNVEACLWFFENGLFLGHQDNREKLIKYLRNNYYTNILNKRLKIIGDCCTIQEFSKKNMISCATAGMYLLRNAERGFLENIKKDKKRVEYKLTEKGEHFLSLMCAITLSHFPEDEVNRLL